MIEGSPFRRFAAVVGSLVSVPVFELLSPRDLRIAEWIDLELLSTSVVGRRSEVRREREAEDPDAWPWPETQTSPLLTETVVERETFTVRVRYNAPTRSDVGMVALRTLRATLGSPRGSDVLEAHDLGFGEVLAGPAMLPYRVEGRERSLTFLDLSIHASVHTNTGSIESIDRSFVRRTP